MQSDRRGALYEALGASAAVTVLVTAASAWVPEPAVAMSVGFVFLAATWLFVWRRDDADVERSGVSFGGLVLPGPLDAGRAMREALVAVGWALAFAALFFVPFTFGWRAWWHAGGVFSLAVPPAEIANAVLAQLVLIALPEEAFYRGYLQTRLDDVWPVRICVLGAPLGPGIVVASAIFALGHVATVHAPARLAVFFPALAFGWLRARTGGIGAAVVFHATCNLFSEALGRGYGLY